MIYIQTMESERNAIISAQFSKLSDTIETIENINEIKIPKETKETNTKEQKNNEQKEPKYTKHEQIMHNAGISDSDFKYADYIVFNESSYNASATNPETGAYGLCQALPPEKMASSGSDWKTNPETQMEWCNGYAQSRYGSWENAYDFHRANGWW